MEHALGSTARAFLLLINHLDLLRLPQAKSHMFSAKIYILIPRLSKGESGNKTSSRIQDVLPVSTKKLEEG